MPTFLRGCGGCGEKVSCLRILARRSRQDQNQVHYDNIRALTVSDFDGESIWNVGRMAADGDFPILTAHAAATQGAAIAYGLTRARADATVLLSWEDAGFC